MFGLVERARLGMYKSTLQQTISDIRRQGELLYYAGVMQGVAYAGIAITQTFEHNGGYEIKESLEETVESIPSAALPYVDSFFISNVKPDGLVNLPFYQAATLIGGLVYVRIVEVAKPKYFASANEYRNSALEVLEPLFDFGLRIMRNVPQPVT